MKTSITYNDFEVLEEGIKSGKFNVNQFLEFGQTPLALAAELNNLDAMKMLIENGADVNLNDQNDLAYTPIETAARKGNIEAIQLLLDNGADINKGNSINTNAFIGACISANMKTIEFLLDNGANINHTDHEGQNALHYICKYGKKWSSSISFFEIIYGVEHEVPYDRTQDFADVVYKLAKRGIDLNAETIYGYTALHLCGESNARELIPFIADYGGKVNAKNAKNYTPLHAAIENDSFETAIELLAWGADPNAEDIDGFTPLLCATANEDLELVEHLIKNGAKNLGLAKTSLGIIQEGDTALSLAERMGDTEILELLKPLI